MGTENTVVGSELCQVKGSEFLPQELFAREMQVDCYDKVEVSVIEIGFKVVWLEGSTIIDIYEVEADSSDIFEFDCANTIN